jgi:Ca-activated chloride channel family protein
MNRSACYSIILSLVIATSSYSQDAKTRRVEVAQDNTPVPPTEHEAEGWGPSIPGLLTDKTEFTISKKVDEVNLFLSITDAKGRFVDNVTAGDLKLLDNHKSPEKWNYFQARTNLPLRVILAVDVSSSVRERLRFEQQAASAFLKHILRTETDDAAILAFGSTVQEKNVSFTSDVNALEGTIHSLQAGGETAMYDAIVLASHKLQLAKRTGVVRSVIILITDGVDTASRAQLKDAEEAAARAEAVIFALDANSIYETNPKGRLILEKLSHETGGFVVPARENSALKGAFSTVEKILRCQYALGYPPPDLEADGSFRPIVMSCSKRGLQIHARNGYYAPTK